MAKRFIILSIPALFFLTGIQCQSSINGFINGEGEVVRQEITLEAFHGLNLGISGDVVITQGSPQKIVLEGQPNILDNIRREVKNGVWKIYFDKDVRQSKSVTIYVTVPKLDEVGLSGNGSIRTTNKVTGIDEMDIHVAGSGNIDLDYTANSTDLNLSGSGKINLSGESRVLSIAISGSGDVIADDLKTDDTSIRISGSGDAMVNANKNLEASISGSGDVRYYGNASVNTRVSGSGEVSKVN